MTWGDITRIGTNLQSLAAMAAFQATNSEIAMRQLRLATGSRLNSAEDDSAAYRIASKLQARIRGQGQAHANIGDAKNLLTVAEGSLDSVMEILQTMKEKATQAANDTLGSDERTAIDNSITALSDELTDILGDTKFNSLSLFTSTAFSFQVGDSAADSFSVTVGTLSAAALGVDSGSIDVSSAANATALIAAIDTAINTVSSRVGSVGDSQSRLTLKQNNLSTAMLTNEAALSRIQDADFAREQMELARLQILQQSGVASVVHANASPEIVLGLL